VAWMQSPELANVPVRIVCEVQALLQPYLETRKAMHLFYKMARSEPDAHLCEQFTVPKPEDGCTPLFVACQHAA
jgi:hypothetical protein